MTTEVFTQKEREELKQMLEESKLLTPEETRLYLRFFKTIEKAEEERDALSRYLRYVLQTEVLPLECGPQDPADTLLEALREDAPWNAACRVCGCSWFKACPVGCSWAEPNLCSACAGETMPEAKQEDTE